MHDDTYFRLRGWIPMPLYALTLLAFDSDPVEHWELALGAGLALAGVTLRAWARLQIGRSSDTRRLHARRLVDGGPYAWTRNPLYLGNIAIACGLAVLLGAGAWTALLGALLGLHYDRVVRAEERMLDASFGPAYRAYRAQVGRWLPLRRRATTRRSPPVEPGALRRELRIAALAALGAALALALRL